MSRPRPQSYLALALATLAVTLATWWAWETFTGAVHEADEAGGRSTWLPPLDDEPLLPDAEPEPRAQPPEEERTLDEPKPPLAPNKSKPPVLVAPSRVEEGPAEPEPEVLAPDRDEKRGRRDDMRAPSSRNRLLGGVARTNERATTEIRVGRGTGWIGSPASWVAGLANQRRRVPFVALPMEAPRHQVSFEDFWIDRFEVPNHRYQLFLAASSRVLYRTSDQPARTLVEITRYVVQDAPDNVDLEGVTTRQLFEANRGVLMQAFPGSVVKGADDEVDFDATFARIKGRIVPPNVDLGFYTRAPPATWPSDVYLDEEKDHPVRAVSVEDAMAFAVYTGRFVPTEQQWEYAARGASGSDWPWGNDGSQFTSNVQGGFARPAHQEPETVSIYHFGEGRSWVGAFQMIGNVSEWTSSFLDAYPGGVRTRPGSAERNVVVRGGSAYDQDRYVMRPAFRGWLATDPDGPPTAGQARAWTGFRTARYGQRYRTDAIHSRVPVMHFRGRKGRRLARTLLQGDVFAGLEGQHTNGFQHIVDEPEDIARRKPRVGWKTIVINPLAVAGVSPRGRWVPNTDDQLRDVEQLAALDAPVAYAILHTDVHLLDAWHAASGRSGAPGRLDRADVPPGTYLVVSVQGVLALMKPDASDVWYLSNRPSPTSRLNVIEREYPPGARAPTLGSFRLVSKDRVDLDFTVPMHADARPGYAARIALRLRPDPRETSTLLDVRQAQGPR